ncbi:hypothetical protein C8R45DRAFT_1084290 [Mycena sanguinolenta]|nr:hypothetical protein C8R45DRAFT_1084290 [Mycena sanguinolenta]
MLTVRATAASEMAMTSAIRPTTRPSSSMPLGLLHHPFIPRVPCCAVSLGVHVPADSQAGGFVTSRVKFCYVGANSLFNHFWNLAMAETKRYTFSGQDLDSILKAFEEQEHSELCGVTPNYNELRRQASTTENFGYYGKLRLALRDSSEHYVKGPDATTTTANYGQLRQKSPFADVFAVVAVRLAPSSSARIRRRPSTRSPDVEARRRMRPDYVYTTLSGSTYVYHADDGQLRSRDTETKARLYAKGSVHIQRRLGSAQLRSLLVRPVSATTRSRNEDILEGNKLYCAEMYREKYGAERWGVVRQRKSSADSERTMDVTTLENRLRAGSEKTKTEEREVDCSEVTRKWDECAKPSKGSAVTVCDMMDVDGAQEGAQFEVWAFYPAESKKCQKEIRMMLLVGDAKRGEGDGTVRGWRKRRRGQPAAEANQEWKREKGNGGGTYRLTAERAEGLRSIQPQPPHDTMRGRTRRRRVGRKSACGYTWMSFWLSLSASVTKPPDPRPHPPPSHPPLEGPAARQAMCAGSSNGDGRRESGEGKEQRKGRAKGKTLELQGKERSDETRVQGKRKAKREERRRTRKGENKIKRPTHTKDLPKASVRGHSSDSWDVLLVRVARGGDGGDGEDRDENGDGKHG